MLSLASLHLRFARNDKPQRLTLHVVLCNSTGEPPERTSFSRQWIRAFSSLPDSRVLKAIRSVVGANAIFTVLVTLAYKQEILTLKFDPLMHHLLAVPLGLLLVLRTTHAYDRFWAARCAWQSLSDSCRELCRRSATWIGEDTLEKRY